MESGRHIPSRRLVDFMLYQFQLTEQEHDHLARCVTCQEEMTEATSREMMLPRANGKGNHHVLRSRLVAYMLQQFALSDTESAHLAKCAKCQHEMTDSAQAELLASEKKERLKE